MEKRHNYVRKVAETAVQLFVSNDKVNVAGLVLAGSADFKTELSQSDMFDPVRLNLFFGYSQYNSNSQYNINFWHQKSVNIHWSYIIFQLYVLFFITVQDWSQESLMALQAYMIVV